MVHDFHGSGVERGMARIVSFALSCVVVASSLLRWDRTAAVAQRASAGQTAPARAAAKPKIVGDGHAWLP